MKDSIKTLFILLSLCFYFIGCAGPGIPVEELIETQIEEIPVPIVAASLGEVSLGYTPQDVFEGEKLRKALQLILTKSNIFSPNATHRINISIDELYVNYDNFALTFNSEARGSYSVYTENDALYETKVVSKGKSDWDEHVVGAVRQERAIKRALGNNFIEFIQRFRLYVKNNSQAVAKLFQDYQNDPIAPPFVQQPVEPVEPIAPPYPQQPPKAVESIYSGTGFLFSAKDYVITNWHVVRGTDNIKVKFLNGEKIEAEVALKDPQNDIAFLKLSRQPKLPPSNLKIGDSSNMKMGDKVFTIGYPAHFLMGENPKYTEGVVNATSGLQDDPTIFQVSVQIQPGNSGGPLFNSSGEVIGITQSSLDPKVAIGALGTLPQNVNYAIKSSYISALLPMLPQTLIASRGIVVVPTEPENTLANFIEKAKKNIVLIEAKE